MLLHEKALKETGLTESTVSTKCKGMLSALKGLIADKAKYQASLSEATDDEEKEALISDLDNITDDIDKLDADLAAAIKKYAPMAETYKRNIAKMQENKRLKQASRAQGGPAAPPAAPPAPATPPAPADPKDDKEKGMGVGGWILAIGLGALTLGAVNYFRKR